ncbi:MAG TPA: hemerythrin domain-containing protein [Draconibacterium sp.]|nr:hemerythrin domain-containing protein [Draconibacterium sp.]
MYQTHKTFITPDMRLSDLIAENSLLLLLLEHFEIDFAVKDKTVKQLCTEYSINLPVFLVFGNLYNGFYPDEAEIDALEDVSSIIRFLKSSHRFYKHDKYPELKAFLVQLHEKQERDNILLIEKFFNDYFGEVLEHLDYEESVVFPYICSLIESGKTKTKNNFSANEYRDHHTDIETKLTDLKNLLLKHISLKNDFSLRRKFLFSLFELEFDLNIHSLIEDKILLPLVGKIETNPVNG